MSAKLKPPVTDSNSRFVAKKEVVRMERTQEERTKYPDRINLDRRGLHGIPVLTEEPGLRLLSLQHNFIKKVHNLEFISRLVFLDLYHNRLDHIASLEPLTNLRVLMLGKNRIRKIECLNHCPKLSVLDLHGNRIGAIVGLDKLTELKVLNLASNLIRKVTGLQNLGLLEELNLRRNRIRTTSGLETVPSLQKLYMSNNEIQGLSSLVNLDNLARLQTIQMEGNPVWSNPDYSYHLISSLPALVTLDQQDVSQDTRACAKRWKHTKETKNAAVSRQPSPNSDKSIEKSKALLYKKLEERNASISNAKFRWNFLKTKVHCTGEDEEAELGDRGESPAPGQEEGERPGQETATGGSDQDSGISSFRCSAEVRSPDPESREVQIKLEVPAISDSVSRGAIPKIIKRQSSDKVLIKPSVNITPPGPTLSEPERARKVSAPVCVNMPPPLPIRDSAIRIKFPGLERRKFALPQRYETLNDSDESQKTFTRSNSLQDLNEKQKIGFFTVMPKKVGLQGESSSTCQSDDEDISGDFLSDSQTSSDTETDSDEADRAGAASGGGAVGGGFPSHTSRRILDKNHTARGRSLAKNIATSRSSSQFSEERGPTRNWTSIKTPGNPSNVLKTTTTPSIPLGPSYSRKKTSEIGELSGRTSEQGKDYLIELDGDLLSVYGSPAIKYLDRPWNKHRALKASTVQFNFLSYDELVPFLSRFRDNFPNVEHYEFTDTNLHSMNQINGLALVQGITSLTINEEGNPIFQKNWRPYAIFRLEHWGLLYVNNQEVSDDEILSANETYGSLGELAIMSLPKQNILNLFKKLELGDVTKEMTTSDDFLATIKDANVKEIIAKESLEYHPSKSSSDTVSTQRRAAGQLIGLGHSVFHKFGRLQDEWVCILPIVIHRILAQYQDIQNYKKGELGKLEHSIVETTTTTTKRS